VRAWYTSYWRNLLAYRKPGTVGVPVAQQSDETTRLSLPGSSLTPESGQMTVNKIAQFLAYLSHQLTKTERVRGRHHTRGLH
jgi:hypothetical protein